MGQTSKLRLTGLKFPISTQFNSIRLNSSHPCSHHISSRAAMSQRRSTRSAAPSGDTASSSQLRASSRSARQPLNSSAGQRRSQPSLIALEEQIQVSEDDDNSDPLLFKDHSRIKSKRSQQSHAEPQITPQSEKSLNSLTQEQLDHCISRIVRFVMQKQLSSQRQIIKLSQVTDSCLKPIGIQPRATRLLMRAAAQQLRMSFGLQLTELRKASNDATTINANNKRPAPQTASQSNAKRSTAAAANADADDSKQQESSHADQNEELPSHERTGDFVLLQQEYHSENQELQLATHHLISQQLLHQTELSRQATTAFQPLVLLCLILISNESGMCGERLLLRVLGRINIATCVSPLTLSEALRHLAKLHYLNRLSKDSPEFVKHQQLMSNSHRGATSAESQEMAAQLSEMGEDFAYTAGVRALTEYSPQDIAHAKAHSRIQRQSVTQIDD